MNGYGFHAKEYMNGGCFSHLEYMNGLFSCREIYEWV